MLNYTNHILANIYYATRTPKMIKYTIIIKKADNLSTFIQDK